MSYNVVYEYTPDAGLYAGNRYWTSYPSKEAFDEARAENPKADRTVVVAEGVTQAEAIRIHGEVSLARQFATAFAEGDTGRVIDDGRMIVHRILFEMQVANIALANGLDPDDVMQKLAPLVEFDGPSLYEAMDEDLPEEDG